MSISYSSLCDDFYIDMYINTRFDLPSERETLLTFFERITRQFPSMKALTRDSGAGVDDRSVEIEYKGCLFHRAASLYRNGVHFQVFFGEFA